MTAVPFDTTFEAKTITLDEVRSHAQEMFDKGWRFVTQTLLDKGDEFELLYHYDLENLELKHFRLRVPKTTHIPSISDIYFCALLVENENQDLFGIVYDGIVLDFSRTLYLDEAGDPVRAPFCTFSTYTKAQVKE